MKAPAAFLLGLLSLSCVVLGSAATARAEDEYPRRALVIGVHNYLYANPVRAGDDLPEALTRGLRIPANQIVYLSDAAKEGRRAPRKDVIRGALTGFLKASRPQDRVLVFFIGHAVEIDDKACLVPIEGDLDAAATLIPLQWVYDQMARCPARQKVLVLDVNRLNPERGSVRPHAGPMGAKMDAALKNPPDGVQVLTACVAGQQSYELGDGPAGIFLNALSGELTPDENRARFIDRAGKPEDPLPIKALTDLINAHLRDDLAPYKLVQTARLTGREAKVAPADDRPPSDAPKAAAPEEIQSILDEISLPPVQPSAEDAGVQADMLPPFAAEKMAAYAAAGVDTDLRKAVRRTRQVLWAVSPSSAPARLSEEVKKVRGEFKLNLSVFRDGYRAPANENAFRRQVFDDERQTADLLGNLMEAHDALKEAGEKGYAEETKRWQANYDYTLARLEMQIAYLFEYEAMLGEMRKELPPRDPKIHGGWKLAAQPALNGDSMGKQLAKAAGKVLDKVAADNPGTPWEVLARREKLTALGLEWRAVP